MILTGTPIQFQSTLPARGATVVPKTIDEKVIFQSTLPARGATTALEAAERLGLFQSTLPARGATSVLRGDTRCLIYFNPRSPHGERRGGSGFLARVELISIHAPRTGSDVATLWTSVDGGQFQSTLPARGATDTTFSGVCPTSFQSTLPARRATG